MAIYRRMCVQDDMPPASTKASGRIDAQHGLDVQRRSLLNGLATYFGSAAAWPANPRAHTASTANSSHLTGVAMVLGSGGCLDHKRIPSRT